MGATSDPRTLVLHGLRLKGVAEPDVVAGLARLHVDRVAAELDRLRAEGLVTYRAGRLTGFALTAAGRVEHGRLLAAELDAAGVRDPLAGWYHRFVELNPELLEVCTRWQLRDVGGRQVVNDHTDPAHDAAVIAELGQLHHRAIPVLDELAGLLARFARYRPELDAALAAVQAGDLDRFTKPVVPSYHTTWFELHEDLLATLGIERSAEVPA